jgi:hypothetical protein
VLALGEHLQPLQALTGGAIDAAWREDWMQFPSSGATVDWRQRLQAFLAERLPGPLVPSTYVELEALPLTSNGKVDRRALPAPDSAVEPTRDVPPANETERVLSDLLRDILSVERVGVHHRFFELGATSIHLARFRNRLQLDFQRPVSMAELFNHSTISLLARFLSQGAEQEAARTGQDMDLATQRGAAQKNAMARRRELLASKRRS